MHPRDAELHARAAQHRLDHLAALIALGDDPVRAPGLRRVRDLPRPLLRREPARRMVAEHIAEPVDTQPARHDPAFVAVRSEEHTSELQSLMRISYAVFCLKKKK